METQSYVTYLPLSKKPVTDMTFFWSATCLGNEPEVLKIYKFLTTMKTKSNLIIVKFT